MPQVTPVIETFARIKVIGVGGAGSAAINRMIEAGVEGVEFVVVNTDAQALHHSKAQTKIHIGQDSTRGLGAGSDPGVGQEAAQESLAEIKEVVKDTDMVFVTIGAGGGTGSGAGHVVASAALDAGALVVGFATKPFAFEGEKRRKNAELAIDNLRKAVDTLIVIPNDRLLQTIDRQTPLLEAFRVADDVLRQGVQGISDLIMVNGLINLDFADVRTVMRQAGSALMGIGRASGEDRATHAAQQAIESPLLEVSIDGARGILFNVIGGSDMSMHEINQAAETITAAADPDANIIFGATINPDIEGEMIITVVATGFDDAYYANRNADRQKGSSIKGSSLRVASNVVNSGIDASSNDSANIADINMDLGDDREPESTLTDSDKGVKIPPNIWSLDSNDSANHDNQDDNIQGAIIGSVEEEELEKPSFLRRLARRKQNIDSDNQDSNGQ